MTRMVLWHGNGLRKLIHGRGYDFTWCLCFQKYLSPLFPCSERSDRHVGADLDQPLPKRVSDMFSTSLASADNGNG